MNHFTENTAPQNHYWEKFMKDDMEIDFSEVGKYIKGELDKNISFMKKDSQESSEEKERKNLPLKYSILEIIGCTVVQIAIPPNVDLEQIQVFIETNELVIIIKSESIQQVIPLQVKASTYNCKAYFHNFILEIRVPHDLNKNYINIPITPIK